MRIDAVEKVLGSSVDEARAALLSRIRTYVEMESPSGDAARIVQLSEHIEEELHDAGATVQRHDAPGLGRNLSADFAGSDPQRGTVVLLAHIDTVHPVGTIETMPFRVVDGRATGPGVYDMKTGAALFVEATRLVRARGSGPRSPVRLLLTCDEEIGSHSAKPLFEAAAQNASAALVTEPSLPDGGVKTARKGVLTYRVTAHGEAAHAGIAAGQKPNAIHELIHQLQRILEFEDTEKGTTICVGLISGGTASNVIAARASAAVDVRVMAYEEWDRIEAAMHSLRPHDARARLEVVLSESRGPLVRNDAVVELYEHARDIASDLGVELGEGLSGGGSDGSLIASLGVPTLDGLGARGGGAHAVDEHVVIDDLPFRLALLVRLLETL